MVASTVSSFFFLSVVATYIDECLSFIYFYLDFFLFFLINEKMKKKCFTHSFEGMKLLKYHGNSELFKLFVEKKVAKI